MKRIKIIVIGGHLSPALAFLDALSKEKYESIFIGRMTEMEGDAHISQEFRLVTNRGIRFVPLVTGRLTRYLSVRTIIALVKIPVGLVQACWIMLRERPRAIVSFGGYLSIPVALAGWIFRVPILIHEQTRVPGLANRFIGALSKVICLTFDDSAAYFASKNTIVTGLPLRKELFDRLVKPAFIPNSTLPIIYVTGGTTGAVSMNALVFPLISKLTVEHIVVHQTGERSMEIARSTKESLSEEVQHRYIPWPYIDERDVSWILQNAKLVIGRSGANTVIELAALGKVAVFIPLPWSAGGEQYKNASYLKGTGSSEIFDQHNGTAESLKRIVDEVLVHYSRYHACALALSKSIPKDGVARLVAQLAHIVQ